MKNYIRRNLLFLIICVGVICTGATIGTLTQLPDAGGVFTTLNHDTINTDLTTIGTNFANINNVLGGAGTSPSGTGNLCLTTNCVLTTPTINSPTGLIVDCATTAACPSTARAYHAVMGIGLLATGSPSTYAVTTISPAFTSASTYDCVAQDVTTIANNVGVLTAGYVSGSAVTFTGPNTNTDTFRFTCVGY